MKKGYFTLFDKFSGKCKLVNNILYFYNTNGDELFSSNFNKLLNDKIIIIDTQNSTEIFGTYNFIGYSGTFHLFSSIENILIDDLSNFSF